MFELKHKTVEDKAIELWATDTTSGERNQSWRSLPGFDKEKYRKRARSILEAANKRADTDTVERGPWLR